MRVDPRISTKSSGTFVKICQICLQKTSLTLIIHDWMPTRLQIRDSGAILQFVDNQSVGDCVRDVGLQYTVFISLLGLQVTVSCVTSNG